MTVPFKVHRPTLIASPRERRRNLSAHCNTYLEAGDHTRGSAKIANLAKLCTVCTPIRNPVPTFNFGRAHITGFVVRDFPCQVMHVTRNECIKTVQCHRPLDATRRAGACAVEWDREAGYFGRRRFGVGAGGIFLRGEARYAFKTSAASTGYRLHRHIEDLGMRALEVECE